MWIKIILFTALAVIALLGLRAPRGARHLAFRRLALLTFIGFAGASVLFPEFWNGAAELVGVGRGSDLLLYGLIVVFIVYVESSYLRTRRLEQDITELARRIAITETRVDEQV